jgi:hypothetical protein
LWTGWDGFIAYVDLNGVFWQVNVSTGWASFFFTVDEVWAFREEVGVSAFLGFAWR